MPLKSLRLSSDFASSCLLVPSSERLRRSGADFVRHDVARASVKLLRRVRQKIRDARGVDARVLLDLRSEDRLLVRLFEERAPIRMKARVDASAQRIELGLDLLQETANALERSFH